MCDLVDGPRRPERFRTRISPPSANASSAKHGGYHYGATRPTAAPSQVVWVQATPGPLHDRRL
jgi:hypothetical protein